MKYLTVSCVAFFVYKVAKSQVDTDLRPLLWVLAEHKLLITTLKLSIINIINLFNFKLRMCFGYSNKFIETFASILGEILQNPNSSKSYASQIIWHFMHFGSCI